MNLELSKKQFRRLLDLVYIGNWILNSTRGQERFADYDEVESLVFARAAIEGMPGLAELYQGEIVPSRAFVEGGIHEAIAEYENNVFFHCSASKWLSFPRSPGDVHRWGYYTRFPPACKAEGTNSGRVYCMSFSLEKQGGIFLLRPHFIPFPI